jgi:hypothetical protein
MAYWGLGVTQWISIVCAEGVQSLVEDDEEDATSAINQHQLELDAAHSTEYSLSFSGRCFCPLSSYVVGY